MGLSSLLHGCIGMEDFYSTDLLGFVGFPLNIFEATNEGNIYRKPEDLANFLLYLDCRFKMFCFLPLSRCDMMLRAAPHLAGAVVLFMNEQPSSAAMSGALALAGCRGEKTEKTAFRSIDLVQRTSSAIILSVNLLAMCTRRESHISVSA